MTPPPPRSAPIGAPVPNWSPPLRPERTILRGRLVSVEPLDPARHGDSLFAANAESADGAIWTYLTHGPYETREDYAVWLESAARSEDPLFFAIVDRASDRALGVASYLRIAPESGSIEVGHLCFAPRLQRTVGATEAMSLMRAYVFALGYRRYEWKCNALNAPSRRAALRLGFSYEGVFRQASVVKGCNRDTAWYAMIDAEEPALAAAYATWLAPANFDADGRQAVSLSSLTAPILVQRG